MHRCASRTQVPSSAMGARDQSRNSGDGSTASRLFRDFSSASTPHPLSTVPFLSRTTRFGMSHRQHTRRRLARPERTRRTATFFGMQPFLSVPHFYFDVLDSDQVIKDSEGIDFA